MRRIFSVDSKFGQMMCFIADVVLLNVLYLICCIPIVTIGPAQTALYSAIRPLRDTEDDRSCYKLFFKSFKSGFFTVTLVWLLFLVFDGILFYTMWMAYDYADTGLFVHWGVPLAGLLFSLVLHSLTTVFHAQFSCTPSQLFRNVFLLLVTNPFHSLLVGILTWLPAILALLKPQFFVDWFPLFLAVYYSMAMLVNATIMKKPFQRIIDSMEGESLTVKEESKISG